MYCVDKHSETSRRHVPDAAACNRLLAKLYSAQGDTIKAMDHYIDALKINPFMWDAFTAICDTGAIVRPSNVFKMTPEMVSSLSDSSVLNGNGTSSQLFAEPKNPFITTPEIDPFNPPIRTGDNIGLNLGGSNLLSKLNGSLPFSNNHGQGSQYPDVDTPTSNGQNMPDEDVMMGDVGGPVMHEPTMEPPHAPGRKARLQAFTSVDEPPKMKSITSRGRSKLGSESTETDIPRPIGQNGHKRTVSGHSMQQPHSQPLDPTAAPPRRSVRLLNSISSIRPTSGRLASAANREAEGRERRELRKAKATGTKGRPTTSSTSNLKRVVSQNSRKPAVEISEPPPKPEPRPPIMGAISAPAPKMTTMTDTGKEREAVQYLLDLLQKLGTGYSHLSHFRCLQALETFDSIEASQRNTPWVLAQIGKAYYERSMFVQAEDIFLRIHKMVPSRMEDMEVYSNALWQLKKETELSHLAHKLMDQDRLSPQAWCALGNAFSLQRDHDQAIKCFTRATQLDPKFAYAFTLQGHEHVSNDEFDKALYAYRCAVSADNRHFNGWYGLGHVYERMGKFDVAEKHYRAAATINPTNALLAVKIGLVSPLYLQSM